MFNVMHGFMALKLDVTRGLITSGVEVCLRCSVLSFCWDSERCIAGTSLGSRKWAPKQTSL